MSNPRCPYCGGEMEYHWENNPMLPEGWFYCLNCHSQAPAAKSRKEAYAAAMKRFMAKGEWIDMTTKHEQRAGRHDYRCSLCKERASNFVGGYDEWWDMWTPNFCPNCGADMRKEANDER